VQSLGSISAGPEGKRHKIPELAKGIDPLYSCFGIADREQSGFPLPTFLELLHSWHVVEVTQGYSHLLRAQY
jgi:hypothetical protein